MNQTLDRTDRRFQGSGDLIHRVAFDIPQQHRLARVRFELANRVHHLFLLLLVLDSCVRRGSTVGHIQGSVDRQVPHDWAAPSSLLDPTCNGKHERWKLGRFASHPRKRSNQLGKRLGRLLLSQVIASKEPEQRALELLDERLVRGRLPRF
jgi:hypothetical protein